MKRTNILVRVVLITALVVVPAACDSGPATDESERPRARRTSQDQLQKANLSKATYAVPAVASGPPAEPGTWHAGRLDATDPVLGDSTHYDVWMLAGEQGDRYVVTMESTGLDAFLMVAGPLDGEASLLAEDDDGAGGTNARVELVIPRTGRYAIVANSVFPSELGMYRIRVDSLGSTVARRNGPGTVDGR